MKTKQAASFFKNCVRNKILTQEQLDKVCELALSFTTKTRKYPNGFFVWINEVDNFDPYPQASLSFSQKCYEAMKLLYPSIKIEG